MLKGTAVISIPYFTLISNITGSAWCRFRVELHMKHSLEKNVCISSSRMTASDSVSLPRLDSPGVCPTSHRQWADFLVSLMAPLHRQYKTARTETRWHLLLKIRQMPIQTSASRGYVLFRSADKRCTKVLKLSADCGHTRGVLQTWKDTDHRRCKTRRVRNAVFFDPNFQMHSIWNRRAWSSPHIT